MEHPPGVRRKMGLGSNLYLQGSVSPQSAHLGKSFLLKGYFVSICEVPADRSHTVFVILQYGALKI